MSKLLKLAPLFLAGMTLATPAQACDSAEECNQTPFAQTFSAHGQFYDIGQEQPVFVSDPANYKLISSMTLSQQLNCAIKNYNPKDDINDERAHELAREDSFNVFMADVASEGQRRGKPVSASVLYCPGSLNAKSLNLLLR